MTEQIINRAKINANLVTPPSLFLYHAGPKILLLGSGIEWKNQFIEFATNNWVFDPVSIFYYLNDDEENLNEWIWFNSLNSDMILVHLSEEIIDSENLFFLLGLFAKNEKCFLSIDPKVESKFEKIAILYHQVNSNIIVERPLEHVNLMKKIWHK